jgi:hypothetical protein
MCHPHSSPVPSTIQASSASRSSRSLLHPPTLVIMPLCRHKVFPCPYHFGHFLSAATPSSSSRPASRTPAEYTPPTSCGDSVPKCGVGGLCLCAGATYTAGLAPALRLVLCPVTNRSDLAYSPASRDSVQSATPGRYARQALRTHACILRPRPRSRQNSPHHGL